MLTAARVTLIARMSDSHTHTGIQVNKLILFYHILFNYSSTLLSAHYGRSFTLFGYFMVILQCLIPFDTFASFNSSSVQPKASNHVLCNSSSLSLHIVWHICICRSRHHPFCLLSFILSSDRLLVHRLSNRLVRV